MLSECHCLIKLHLSLIVPNKQQLGMQAPSVTLTCAQCQRRKVRCDKKSPCGPCQLADLSCVTVQRPRRPRGRRACGDDKSAELQARVARLEALLRDLQAPSASSERSNDHPLTSSASTASISPLQGLTLIHGLHPPDSKANPFVHADSKTPIVASSFWAALSDEVRRKAYLSSQESLLKYHRDVADSFKSGRGFA